VIDLPTPAIPWKKKREGDGVLGLGRPACRCCQAVETNDLRASRVFSNETCATCVLQNSEKLTKKQSYILRDTVSTIGTMAPFEFACQNITPSDQ
jgi:hypothetical protein